MFTNGNCTYCLPSRSTNVNSTYILPTTFTNVHKLRLHAVCPQQSQNDKSVHNCLRNIHKCSQMGIARIACPVDQQMLIPHISCLQRSQMFTNFAYMQFAHNSLKIHKHSQSLPPCKVYLQHSQNGKSMHTCPRTFTNVHKVVLDVLLAQYVNSTYFLPRTFTNVHKICLHAKFSHNSFKMHSCLRTFTTVHKVVLLAPYINKR